MCEVRKSIVRIESIREFKNSDKEKETSTRYYISSLKNDALYFQSAYTFSLGY